MATAIVDWGYIYREGDNGKENGNYYSRLGSYWDNGKENWKLLYYNRVNIGIM